MTYAPHIEPDQLIDVVALAIVAKSKGRYGSHMKPKHWASESQEKISTNGLEKFFEVEHEERFLNLRGDFNMSRLPYFAVGDKKEDRFRDMYLKESINKNGRTIEVEWEVQHSARLGLPGSFDRDVWFGILEIIHDITRGGKLSCPDTIEIGTLRSFLQRIGKPGDGRYCQKLKESIERLARTCCVSKSAFNCPAAGGYLGEVFQLISGWGFVGQDNGNGGTHETNFVRLHTFLRKNLDVGYIALIDARFMRDLKTEIAKQLYLLLSYKFWQIRMNGQQTWRVKWQHLENYLGTTWTEKRRAKERLKPALDELIQRGYISEYCWDDDALVLFPGDRYAAEHKQRVLAWDAFQMRQRAEVPSTNKSVERLFGLAARWAQGYKPSDRELAEKKCTIEDLEAVARSQKWDIITTA